jgi:gliding motility-associated-like protein
MKKINKTYFFLFLITLLSFTVSAQLTNGNLEAGGSGTGFFVRDYTQINPLTGVSSPGTYAWTNNPNTMDSSFISGGDHTTGFGKMLVYNGATAGNKFAWTSSGNMGTIGGFTIGLTYTFSYWIKSVSNDVTNSATQANLFVFFNPGAASNFHPSTLNSVAPLPSEGWKQVQFSFTANSTTQLIHLWNLNTSALGNDFALDDFSIRLGGLPLTLSHTSVNPSCPSSLDGSITANGVGGSLPYANYALSSSSATTSNSTGIFNSLAAGTYSLTLTDASGSTTAPIIITLSAPNDITISAPTTICEGTSTTLSVSGSTSSYLWTANPADPSLTAANNTSANPVVSPTVNTTYTVTSGVPAVPTNLIYNGDFSLGDTGFNTGYAYPTPTLQQGTYGIVTNPNAWFNPFVACQDNTGGPGTRNMFVADGATSSPLTLVYKPFFFPIFSPPGSPDVAIVLPNKSYTFSFFLANVVSSGSPAALEVIINGIRVGNLATAPITACTWVEHSFIWNSGSNTTATISIFNTNTASGGNDFAIDDIKFRETPTCLYEKSVAITVNSNLTAPIVDAITQPTCFTTTGSVVLSGLPSGNWTINPGGITGNTTSTTISGLLAGNYTFKVINAAGCESMASANVGISAALTIPSPPTVGTITQPTCATPTGSVVLNDLPSGNWTINPGAITGNTTSTTISGLSTANYNYTVTNSDGCISSASANVGINAQPVTPSTPTALTTVQPTCLALGTVVVSAPLGTDYEYSTGGAYQATLSFSNLAPNTYSVTVKDVLNGCVSLPTSVVVDPIPTVATPTAASIVQPTCIVNGSIVIATPLGTNIEYSNGGTYQSSTTFSNLPPNTYSITAKDITNGCISVPLSVVIDPVPNTSTPSFASIAPVCFGTIISLPLLSTNGVSGTWSPSFIATATTTYTFTPNPGQCSNTTTIQVGIIPIPVGTASPTTETICSLQSTGISLSSSISGTTFSWTATATDVSGANLDNGNIISQILTATGTLVGNVVYTITPTYNGCSGIPIQATVLVTPKPIVTATPSNTSICSGSSAMIALSSTMPNTIFSWNLVQTNVTGGLSGTGSSISQNLSTISNASGNAVYAITPNVNGCPGATTIVTITVNPIPVVTVNPALGQTICSGATTAISLSSPVINTTYDWSVTQTNLNGTFSGSGTTIAQTLSNVLPSIGTATYVITPTALGCIGASASVVVNVNPTPEFFGTPTQLPICSRETTSIVLTPSLSGTTFSWTVVQNGVSGASIGNGNNIFQILETTGNAVGTAVYTVVPALNSCSGIPITISVTVNPLPLPDINDGIICADATGIPLRTYILDSGLNTTDYTFQWFLNGILQSGTATTFEALVAGNYSVIATNILTGCPSDEVFAAVTASIPATSISAVGTVAFDANASIVVTALEPNPNYEYALDYGSLQSSNVFTNVNPGNHIVTVTDSNGCSNLSTTISVIGYPTYFTPNGDGFNDFWNIIGLESQPSSKIYIFDRYGKLLKQISSKSLGWDGTYNGALLPASDYWFTIEYIEPLTTDLKVFKSHFSLKR